MEMAATLQAEGRLTEALDFLSQAEAVAPGDHHVLVEQGKTLGDLGRLGEAEQVLRRACRVRDAAAEYNLATGSIARIAGTRRARTTNRRWRSIRSTRAR